MLATIDLQNTDHRYAELQIRRDEGTMYSVDLSIRFIHEKNGEWEETDIGSVDIDELAEFIKALQAIMTQKRKEYGE